MPEPTGAVDLCVLTYRRPAQLARLLAGLARQRRACPFRLIVVDNDAARSAEALVRRWRARAGWPIVYACEPRQNIALARNLALDLARAPFVAFLDDDETPCPGWLGHLLATAAFYRADAVFGPVLAALPPDTPAWLAAPFRKPPQPTGRTLRLGGAGNVLIRRSALAHLAPWFDPAYGLTGGEDTDLFYRMHLAGRRLVWCAEARAVEAVAPERVQLGWLRRRAYRGGQTYYRVVVRRYARPRRALWLLLKLAQLGAGAIAAPVLRLLAYPAFVRLSLRLAGAAGQLSRCVRAPDLEEYRAPAP